MVTYILIILVIIVMIWDNRGKIRQRINTRTNYTKNNKPPATYIEDIKYERLLREHQKQQQQLREQQLREQQLREQQLREQQSRTQEENRRKALKFQQEQESRSRKENSKTSIAEREKEIYRSKKFKADWQKYQYHLSKNKINTLYHFTDRANLHSIKSHGGLYSWHYCMNNDIDIPMPGGDDLSRSLDRRYNLQNYVRISFTRNHPMMFIAQKQNRIKNPVILEIDSDVVFWENSKYANKNATRNDVNIGSELDDFKKIRFEIVKLNKHFDLDDSEKPYYQAEVLILEMIPLEFIKNINQV